MKIVLTPGKYVIAVSGGVDSMVLLDLLKNLPDVELVVAHYDHGMRNDSDQDRQLVQEATARYGLPFEYEEGKLGAHTSEAVARDARYQFLRRVREDHHATAILTAHHQDDLLETAILNLIRGTGRKGLTALTSRDTLMRPLLHMTKKDILAYAKQHHLTWREDSTNADEAHLRNYIRHQLLPRFDAQARAALLDIVERSQATNTALDAHLTEALHLQPNPNELDRSWFIQLPHNVAKEFLASWLRSHNLASFDSRTLERVVVAAKVGQPSTRVDLIGGASLDVKKRVLALLPHER